jgi:hypothetical protein
VAPFASAKNLFARTRPSYSFHETELRYSQRARIMFLAANGLFGPFLQIDLEFKMYKPSEFYCLSVPITLILSSV